MLATAPLARKGDNRPFAQLNRAGRRRRCYPTIMRSANTYSVRNGTALVYNLRSHRYELPRVRELERMLGLLEGATAADEVTEEEQRQACGNIIDRRMLTWVISNLPDRAPPAPSDSEVDRRELAQLVGKLQFCAKVVHGGQSHLASLYEGRDWFARDADLFTTPKQQWRPGVKVRLTPKMVEELLWWRGALLAEPERAYYCSGSPETSGFWDGRTATPQEQLISCTHTAEGIPVVRTDASGWGGGAEHNGSTMMFYFEPQDCAPHRSSNWRELATVVRTIKHWRHAWAGKRVLIMCDNSVSCSIVRRQGSQAHELNLLYKELYQVCQEYNIDVALRHIRGKDNVYADALSRYERNVDSADWMFDRAEFEWVSTQVGAPHVDACCDPMGNNKLAPIFYSLLQDCCLQPWEGVHTWCNPNYLQLYRVLQHYRTCRQSRDDKTAATFCIPVWMDK